MAETWKEIIPVEETYNIKNLDGWMPDWLNSIRIEQNKLSMIFPSWDAEFRGKLRGSLGLIVGLGGTKKSILAQNIVLYNLAFNESNILTSTMEMSATKWINRLIDICTDPIMTGDIYWSPSWAWEYINQKQPGYAESKYKEIVSMIGDKLWLTDNSAMTATDYDKQLTWLQSKGIKIDMLLADGLSMMGNDTDEVRSASKHTKELKELAKKWNILILLICHVSRGEGAHRVKPEDRDSSSQIRGGEKARDNSDFYICISKIMTNNDFDVKNFGYARLINKRDSGNIIDQIFEIEQYKCSIKPTDLTVDQIKGMYLPFSNELTKGL